MRVKDIWTAADATSTLISTAIEIDCGQDMRYLIQVVKTGTDGTPNLFLEESLEGTTWTCIPNYEDTTEYFPLVEDETGLRDSYFMGGFIRLRLEPNDNTTGTVTAKIGIKTKSN